MNPYCDLHTHSDRSDGRLSMGALVQKAMEEKIGVLAITDHNATCDLTELRAENPGIHLIQGIEASARYKDTTGKVHQPHFIGLGFDPHHQRIAELVRACNPDRTPYNQAQLDALRRVGIDLGTLEEMWARWPGRKQLGTRQFAEDLVRFGHAKSVRDAYDRLLGYEGSAQVFNELHYPDMEFVVTAIMAAGGIPVLPHLYYYGMSDHDNHLFVGQFHEIAGSLAGIETVYGAYTVAQQCSLREEFAKPYNLMESCASDFHGVGLDDSDRLSHRFPREQFAPLLECLL